MLDASCFVRLTGYLRHPMPKLSVQICKDRRVTSEEARPCLECGHAPQVHPRPDSRDLSICAACIYEEDEGLRVAEAMCTRVFPRAADE
ncbi:hypothetical protein MCAG_01645 [Micromonospora sp. ATCC 39149]|nr:hypothetical protein MCAG_01645 [Micromonospora sp. ATCC 39149]